MPAGDQGGIFIQPKSDCRINNSQASLWKNSMKIATKLIRLTEISYLNLISYFVTEIYYADSNR